MPDLSTYYMGLKLENPIIAASSSLSKDLDGIRKLADNGAGAIVMKSLFEEQIQVETDGITSHSQSAWHTEAADYISNMGMGLGSREYLQVLEDAKKAVSTPIIASLNCHTGKWWNDYARQLELAGADALELNISILNSDPKQPGASLDDTYVRILEEVKSKTTIPISLKIGPNFSSTAHLAHRLCRAGADALALFNRYFRLDVDVDRMEITAGNPFSTPDEIHLPLRWIALLSGRITCDLSATTGIHEAGDALKMLLVGASTVQVCSTLFRNGAGQISVIRSGIEEWMGQKDFSSIRQFRGRLSQLNSPDPDRYERLQYIKTFVGIE